MAHEIAPESTESDAGPESGPAFDGGAQGAREASHAEAIDAGRVNANLTGEGYWAEVMDLADAELAPLRARVAELEAERDASVNAHARAIVQLSEWMERVEGAEADLVNAWLAVEEVADEVDRGGSLADYIRSLAAAGPAVSDGEGATSEPPAEVRQFTIESAAYTLCDDSMDIADRGGIPAFLWDETVETATILADKGHLRWMQPNEMGWEPWPASPVVAPLRARVTELEAERDEVLHISEATTHNHATRNGNPTTEVKPPGVCGACDADRGNPLYCAEGYDVPTGRVTVRQGAVRYEAAQRLVHRLNAEADGVGDVRYRVRTLRPASPVVAPSATDEGGA